MGSIRYCLRYMSWYLKVCEYDQEIPQSHNADQPGYPQHHEEEPQNNNSHDASGKQLKKQSTQ